MSESPVIAFLNKMSDLILLNILWIFCCIPVVTAGAATAAMYYVSITSIRCGDGYVLKRFFHSFRQNFRQITPLWIGILGIICFLGYDLYFWMQIGTLFAKIMLVWSAVIGILVYMCLLWIFPVFAKFSGSTKELIKNAFCFAIGYFPYTAMAAVFTGAVIFINLKSVILNSIMLFLGFALCAYIKSFFFYRVFMNHMNEKYDDFWNEVV